MNGRKSKLLRKYARMIANEKNTNPQNVEGGYFKKIINYVNKKGEKVRTGGILFRSGAAGLYRRVKVGYLKLNREERSKVRVYGF
jgi:hypothetical protein